MLLMQGVFEYPPEKLVNCFYAQAKTVNLQFLHHLLRFHVQNYSIQEDCVDVHDQNHCLHAQIDQPIESYSLSSRAYVRHRDCLQQTLDLHGQHKVKSYTFIQQNNHHLDKQILQATLSFFVREAERFLIESCNLCTRPVF